MSTKDDHIIKIFPQRKWLSSNRIKPYAKRFVQHASMLSQRGVLTVNPIKCQRLKGTATYLVHYPLLNGRDIRQRVSEENNTQVLLDLMGYLAELHNKGIFFRGIHLGNVLHQTDGRFALLDITNLKCRRWPLRLHERVRNLKHLLSYPDDVKLFGRVGRDTLLQAYLQHSKLRPKRQRQLLAMCSC